MENKKKGGKVKLLFEITEGYLDLVILGFGLSTLLTIAE